MVDIYRKIIAWLMKQGYFEIHPVVRRVLIQGFIGTMILSTPFFWGFGVPWPVAPLAMMLVEVVKEFLDDKNSGLPAGEYMSEHSVKHAIQVGAGILLVISILIAVASERGLL